MKTSLLRYLVFILLLLPVTASFAQAGATGASGDPATTFKTPDEPTPSEASAKKEEVKDETKDDNTDDKKKKKDKDDDADFLTFSIDRFNEVFFIRLLIDLLSMVLLIRFIYYPVYRKRDYFFTFFMFNLTIFIITYLLNTKSGLSMGAAFGLFAVFSLLRYRTEDISARDMTYLFGVIALGLISSVNKGSMLELSMVNAVIILAAFILDGNIIMKTEFVKSLQYENIELIKPENHAELMADLCKRTGLKIHKISIGKIDFVRDTAMIKVYYYDNNNQD